ncbi:hypothetical protein [Oryzomonas rubra]|uniref:Uncharacterized protein n=1 Tax=Oryzomonas rubra TaxID=2509454 RepID=A0A5A9X750_9BACT|nr:hypothetical protein [Oryzomonas rubra]KAA0888800.1 hypothetical protein ET418_15585 [Oryzomonas rubra]
MSHFTVMVIGNDVEKQLAPFHEFECTGINDEYVQDVDITDELAQRIADGESLEDALSYHGLEDRIVSDESEVEKVGEECRHKYGYAIVKDGKLIKAVNRTNPNNKWDWFQFGGRWSGFFQLKPGATGELGSRSLIAMHEDPDGGPDPLTRADSALKKDIDFAAMRDAAGARAADTYDKARALIDGKLDGYISWDKMRDEVHAGDIGLARKAYHAQPAVHAFSEGGNTSFGFFSSVDEFYPISREEYIKSARAGAIATLAVLKDGKWYEQGEMGWWGVVFDKKPAQDWSLEFSILLDALPDDTLLTVVDCHI